MTDDRRSVLIIDNNAGVRHVLGVMVESFGYAARLAASGAEAVEEYDRHPGATAAVLLDVRMEGQDGPQTLELLRARDPRLPCVFVTGGFTHYTRADLESRGAAVVFKPVRPGDLGRALRDVTGGRGPGEGP
jgi:CheY-like chemotaxis protein